ncbi:MFS transporter [Humibacter sp. RRB41]|uniref:MFS transporter n=1 Tax=Humibacter sp. RRB41 TaxID=2919946 RepID=UPI001FA98CC8|nr:MFS transporter [Humibacter sp. RRB41]
MSHERSDAVPATGTQSGATAVELAQRSTGVEEPVRNRGLVFAIVAMALFMAAVDGTIVATALSTIQHELGAGIAWSGWIITIYALGQILIMPLAGKLADMYGRKRVFLLAAVLFTTASLCCGLAGNIYVLVALRAVQAIGGGAFMPSASGIVSDHFGRDRDRALGMFSSIFPIGGIVGPVLGGIFVVTWSWRGIFLVNVPIGIALIILGLIFIPRGVARKGGRLDLIGVGLLAALLLGAMLGVTYLGSSGSSMLSAGFLVPEFVAVASGVGFVLHAKYAAAPFIPLRLLYGRGFGVMNTINLILGSAALGFGALVPLYAEDRFGIPVLQAGTLLTARAIGMILVAGMATMALRRTGYRLPMVIGFSIVIVGLVGLSAVPQSASPYWWLSIAGAVTGIGMGLAMPAANNATMHLAPENIAAIAGLRGMFRQGGGIISVSIVTAVLARSTDQGFALAISFVVLACLLLAVMPLIALVPNHRGSW